MKFTKLVKAEEYTKDNPIYGDIEKQKIYEDNLLLQNLITKCQSRFSKEILQNALLDLQAKLHNMKLIK